MWQGVGDGGGGGPPPNKKNVLDVYGHGRSRLGSCCSRKKKKKEDSAREALRQQLCELFGSSTITARLKRFVASSCGCYSGRNSPNPSSVRSPLLDLRAARK
ncbi:hypothetical protein KPH14_006323 [Odynerus spinipes]|uniref:Uncharacterized protein n=1 Tax=Odynerus spinipes TaxID=1348599 RepID=A0AAD9VWN0_9HYME|nr:hypothetical protein KPH14_006323 [Odynerus spinipes]